MMRVRKVALDDIYVPTARRATLDMEAARVLAEDILENGLKTPIQVRHDGKRHILVEGLHRLEAAACSATRRSTPIWCRRNGIREEAILSRRRIPPSLAISNT